MSAARLAAAALEYPGTRWAVLASTYDILETDGFYDLRRAFSGKGLEPSPEIAQMSQFGIHLTNESVITGYSAAPTQAHRLRGPLHHGAWVVDILACSESAMDYLGFSIKLQLPAGVDNWPVFQ